MKTVIAIIRINMMNETKKALSEAGIPMMTAIGGAYGRGKGLVEKKIIDAASENVPEAVEYLGTEPRLRPQRVLYVSVSDHNVDLTVNTIMDTNKTGEPGDGKIFVVPEVDVIQVRTGVTGSEALD